MSRTTVRDIRNAFAALQDAHRALGITETITDGAGKRHRVTADDLILTEGSATYGNAWGVYYCPWANGARWSGASAHYTPRGLGGLSTDRTEAHARLRGYVSGIYAARKGRNR